MIPGRNYSHWINNIYGYMKIYQGIAIKIGWDTKEDCSNLNTFRAFLLIIENSCNLMFYLYQHKVKMVLVVVTI